MTIDWRTNQKWSSFRFANEDSSSMLLYLMLKPPVRDPDDDRTK